MRHLKEKGILLYNATLGARNHADAAYHGGVLQVLEHGEVREDRTGTGTISEFGDIQMVFDLEEGFPLLTTKKVFTKGIILELLWFLDGNTNAHDLAGQGVHIWDAWAAESGDLGPIYSEQWRDWKKDMILHRSLIADYFGKHVLDAVDAEALKNEGKYISRNRIDVRPGVWIEVMGDIGWYDTPAYHIVAHYDQIAIAIDQIKNNPYSRRNLVNAWNVGELDEMALPPCHTMFQFYVEAGGRLSCKLYQRSGDMFLGVPFNIASYSLLTMMMAQVCGLRPGRFIHTIGDAHIYSNHVEQVKLQLSRVPRKMPRMIINPEVNDIFSFKLEDFKLEGYDPHPAIRAKVAI